MKQGECSDVDIRGADGIISDPEEYPEEYRVVRRIPRSTGC